jgi:hypothetical protein
VQQAIVLDAGGYCASVAVEEVVVAGPVDTRGGARAHGNAFDENAAAPGVAVGRGDTVQSVTDSVDVISVESVVVVDESWSPAGGCPRVAGVSAFAVPDAVHTAVVAFVLADNAEGVVTFVDR